MSDEKDKKDSSIGSTLLSWFGAGPSNDEETAEVVPLSLASAATEGEETPWFAVDPEWRVVTGGWEMGRNACSLNPEIVRSQTMGAIGRMRSTVKTEGDRLFLADLYQVLGERTLDLPDFPETPMRLDQLLNEEEPNSQQVMRCIEADPNLVGRVWQRARSARFPSAPPSLDMAVSRIGMDEVWRLSFQTAIDSMEVQPGPFKEMAERVRIHGALVGEVTSALVGERRGSSFLAGILQDVGQLLILRVASHGSPEMSTVNQVIEAHRADLSLLIADGWRLDRSIIPGIAYHFDPDAFGTGARDLPRLLRLADISVYGEFDRRDQKNSNFLQAIAQTTRSRVLATRALTLAAQAIDRLEADGLTSA
ncbi:MAG: HDOD domain-containing protein [Myxococcota bacterium]